MKKIKISKRVIDWQQKFIDHYSGKNHIRNLVKWKVKNPSLNT